MRRIMTICPATGVTVATHAAMTEPAFARLTASLALYCPACQQPQIWMAAVDVTTAANQAQIDPSRPAFWLPFQDITTHNHTPYWTQSKAPPPDAGAPCVQLGGNCTQGGTCCTGYVCQANGTCGQVAQ